jgi:hypothetical protein
MAGVTMFFQKRLGEAREIIRHALGNHAWQAGQ